MVADAGSRRLGARLMRDGGARFFRWYRTIPLLVMGLLLALSLGLNALPRTLVRSFLFPVEHAEQINASAARHGVDPYLAAAVIKCESDWNESARSEAGAVGLMQLMPQTAESIASRGLVSAAAYDPDNLTDADTNIEYGCAYLGYLEGQLGSQDEVIAAYNAGLGSVQSWKATSGGSIAENIQYPETRYYLQRVNDAYEHYKDLYPQGLEDS